MTCVRTDIHMVEQNEEISINKDHSLPWHPQTKDERLRTGAVLGSDNREPHSGRNRGHGKFPSPSCRNRGKGSLSPTNLDFSSLFRLPRLVCFGFPQSGFAGVRFHDSHWAPIRILSVVCWGACWTAIYRLLQMETQIPFFYSPAPENRSPQKESN